MRNTRHKKNVGGLIIICDLNTPLNYYRDHVRYFVEVNLFDDVSYFAAIQLCSTSTYLQS